MATEIRFDEPWQAATSPISLQFVTPFMGVTLRFDQLQQVNTSPIRIWFNPFEGVTLRFDESWEAVQSPLYMRFDGSLPPEPEPYPQVLGISVGIGWGAIKAIEQRIALNQHNKSIGQRVSMQSHGEAIARREQLSWACSQVSNRVAMAWQMRFKHFRPLSLRWALPQNHYSSTAIRWRDGAQLAQQTHIGYRCYPALNKRTAVNWITGPKCQKLTALNWDNKPSVKQGVTLRWGFPRPRWVCSDRWLDFAPKGKFDLRFDDAFATHVGALSLRFDTVPMVCHWDYGGGRLNANPVLPNLDFKIPIAPQVRRSYLMTPTITCIRLSDNLPIVLRSISMQQSRTQWAPTATIVFSAKGDAERAAGQAVKISVNGYDFYLLIESIDTRASFGNTTYSASARGLLAELAAPYKKAVNFVNQTERSFMGLASDIVANSGWSVATTMTDYTVPATAWSYQGKTPAEALQLMATAIGAMLDVNSETKTITFIPKWPVSPWLTTTATPDVALPSSVILEHSERTDLRPAANAVLVRGEQIGVARKVKLTGSDGLEFASDVIEKLITDGQAARMRGTHELAETGDKLVTQLRTKLMDNLPPLRPGMLIGVTYAGVTYKATSDSWALTAACDNQGKVTVNQSLTLVRNAA